jgi:hypothetical protein
MERRRQEAEFHHAAGVEYASTRDFLKALHHFEAAAMLCPGVKVHREWILYCQECVQQQREQQQSAAPQQHRTKQHTPPTQQQAHHAHHRQRQQQQQQQQQQQEQEQQQQGARPLASWLRARLRATRSANGACYSDMHPAEAEEQTARERASTDQNREAAKAFFAKTREAIEAGDLDAALRRIRKTVALHPCGGTAEQAAAASLYREWEGAIVSAIEEEEREEGEEAVEAARGATRRRRTPDQLRRRHQASRSRGEGHEVEEAEARYREHEAAKKAERARAAQRRKEEEESRARARREREEESAHAKARARANAEAAVSCVARAADADDATQAVRLLRKAVSLRPWSPVYRALLLRARVRLSLGERVAAIAAWWSSRGGVSGYISVLAALCVLVCGALIVLHKLARRLQSTYCAPVGTPAAGRASHKKGSWRCHMGEWLGQRTLNAYHAKLIGYRGPGSVWPRLPMHPSLLALLLLPLLLAVLLPPRQFLRLGDWRSARAWLWGAVRTIFDLVKSWCTAASKWVEQMFAQFDEFEEAERERRRQHRDRRWQQQQQQQQSRGAGYGRPGSEQHRHDSSGRDYEWHYRQHQQRGQQRGHGYQQQKTPVRPQRSELDLRRERARRLPPGEVRRVLLASTHYEALGVPRTCSAAEAKKAFHKLALRLHPDKCKEEMGEEAFKCIEEANRTLGDRQLRAEYDLTLPAAANHGGAGGRARRGHTNWG